MIEGYAPLMQAVLGTLFGWGMTAAGALLVVPLEYAAASKEQQRLFLDTSLGASAGIMIAASFWSLLAPAIEEGEELWPGKAWIIAAVGFLSGGLIMLFVDHFLPDDLVKQMSPHSSAASSSTLAVTTAVARSKTARRRSVRRRAASRGRRKSPKAKGDDNQKLASSSSPNADDAKQRHKSWKRILMLVIAITLHNAPEGLAVGVSFGGLKGNDHSKWTSARNVAIGIGLQNFPEGLAVSLPLRRQGCSLSMAFFWGQLSGMVEPVAGFLGAYLVQSARLVSPFALAGAAGAMIYVVVNELIPEAHTSGNKMASTWGIMLGFTLMMCMDVAL